MKAKEGALRGAPESLQGLLQFLIRDMGVNLGGGNPGVSQGLLRETQVFGLPQKVR